MKKILAICLLIAVGALSACGAEKTISGEVVEVSVDAAAGGESYVIRTEDSEDIGVIMEQDAYIVPWLEEFDEDAFKTGEQTGVIVTATCKRSRTTLTTKDGKEITAYPAMRVSINGLLSRNALSLSDGTSVNVVKQHMLGTKYQLPDGTELLLEQTAFGPDRVHVAGIESFDHLSEPAKAAILSFYEDQGLLYDVQDELENAYAAYLTSGSDDQFDSHLVGQEVSPSASTDRVMYFRTVVTHPIDGNHIYEETLGAAFDRETGEHIDNFDLFVCSEQEILPNLLDLAGVTEPELRKEMEAAFTPECIVFSPNNMELSFHQGTLPSQEHSFWVAVDYDERLCGILYDWAVPQTGEQAE